MKKLKKGCFKHAGLYLPAAGLILALFTACQHDTVNPYALSEVCFETQVLPVFQSSCGTTGCHSASDHHEYIFTDYSQIVKAVKAGQPDRSAAYIAITASHGEGMMPPSEPLSQNNRMLIRAWIEQGALQTTCNGSDSIIDTTSTWSNPYACFGRDILPVLRSSCAMTGCHDAASHREGYVFDSYTSTMKAVVAGYPGSSKLYKVITANGEDDLMPPPPHEPLTSAQIDSIYNWIARGALDEDCGTACDTLSEISFSAVVSPMINTNCKGCHSGTAPSGGIALTNYQQVAAIAANGKLTGVLKNEQGYVPMPPSGPLDACMIRQVELWVAAGYPNN
ncbi:MAG: c-type cytochrome domain-containing protein [Bacteroidota bacterium]